MDNKVMTNGYCEALAYVITSQAQALKDKNKAGAFIALFLQSVSNKYGEAGLKMVIEAVKKEMTPEALQNLGKPGNKSTQRKLPSLMQRIRTKLKKLPQKSA